MCLSPLSGQRDIQAATWSLCRVSISRGFAFDFGKYVNNSAMAA